MRIRPSNARELQELLFARYWVQEQYEGLHGSALTLPLLCLPK